MPDRISVIGANSIMLLRKDQEMSEAERKRRQDYKRKRKKRIVVQAVLLALAVLIALGSFLVYNRMDRTYYIEYTEESYAGYKVHYKENTFFDEEWIGAGQSYVSSLVKGIKADLSYALEMDTSDVAFDYTYEVTAQMIVADKTSGAHIYDPIDVLVPSTTESVAGSDNFSVDQTVYVDFTKYNALAYQFVNVYGLSNAKSTLLITMSVDVLSACDEFEDSSENTHSVSLSVPLDEESFVIKSTSSVPTGESKVLACRGSVDQMIFLGIAIGSGVFAAMLALILIAYVLLTRNEDVDYANKVRKTLSAYRSFIQQIDGEFDTTGYQVIPIKTFTELLGIRDTIQSPVLMSENEDETRACFLIPTASKLLYLYEIKVDNYDEIYGTAETEETAVEETVVEEPAVEETVIEEVVEPEPVAEEPVVEETHEEIIEHIEEMVELVATTEDRIENATDEELVEFEHAIEEALAEPEVALEDIDFVDEVDEEYEATPECPGVEVIGVVWPERAHKNKIYRYDPAGESLCDSDVVLVPTKDVHRNREVVRKATVAHGNHKVDPEQLKFPLKKIIGVVKRSTSEVDKADKN